ncbi:MAG: hypothetical protein HOW73_16475 [Polyangiaceae bacterium]|nr:hypothetical protein [Polyangiaceae bacterium]
MVRRVRGILFVDYVRMIRGQKNVDWSAYLNRDDDPFLSGRIDLDGWYPMESFERFGLGILNEVAKHQLDGVVMWGRFSVMPVQAHFPTLVVVGDPMETLARFRVLARSFFDYGAIEVVSVREEDALVAIRFEMSAAAEKTACHQTLGFFLGLLEASGGTNGHGRFLEKSWEGSTHTLLDLRWSNPVEERPSRPGR